MKPHLLHFTEESITPGVCSFMCGLVSFVIGFGLVLIVSVFLLWVLGG